MEHWSYAPRSGSSSRISLLLPSIEQPRAAGAPQAQHHLSSPKSSRPAPPESTSSFPQLSSPAQRELPRINLLLPQLGSPAYRSRIFRRKSLLPIPSIEQPRAGLWWRLRSCRIWLPCAESRRDAKWYIRLLISYWHRPASFARGGGGGGGGPRSSCAGQWRGSR